MKDDFHKAIGPYGEGDSPSDEQQNDEQRIDRLVDGEMNETDRRELLVQLEHEPGGWRRCALAFIEAQCWKQDLGELARAPQANPAEKETTLTPIGRQSAVLRLRWATWRQQLASVLTIGASFLIALALGMNMHPGHGPGASVAPTMVEKTSLPAQQELTQAGSATAVPANHRELVTLVATDPSNGRSETVRVPAVTRDELDPTIFEQLPALPPEVQRMLEQSGNRVSEQRELVPVRMDDGRRLVVPVNHVEIHYVGRGSL